MYSWSWIRKKEIQYYKINKTGIQCSFDFLYGAFVFTKILVFFLQQQKKRKLLSLFVIIAIACKTYVCIIYSYSFLSWKTNLRIKKFLGGREVRCCTFTFAFRLCICVSSFNTDFILWLANCLHDYLDPPLHYLVLYTFFLSFCLLFFLQCLHEIEP